MYLSDKNNGSNFYTLDASSMTSGVKYNNFFFWKLNRSNDGGEVSDAIFDWLCLLSVVITSENTMKFNITVISRIWQILFS